MELFNNWEEYTYYLINDLKNREKGKFRSSFFDLHRKDQFRFYLLLDEEERTIFYQFIEAEEFAYIFAKLSHSQKKQVSKELDHEYEVCVINRMPTDELVRFLRQVDPLSQEHYMTYLSETRQREVKQILSFKQGTAGSIMTTEYMYAYHDETIDKVLKRIFNRGRYIETIYYIYVISYDHKLIGVASLRELMNVPTNHRMDFVMKSQTISVRLEMETKELLHLMKEYDLFMLPVLNDRKELAGVVTADDVIELPTYGFSKSFQSLVSFVKQKWSYWFIVFIISIAMLISFNYFLNLFEKNLTKTVILMLLLSLIGGTTSMYLLQRGIKKRFKKPLLKQKNLTSLLILSILVTLLVSIVSVMLIEEAYTGIPLYIGIWLAVSCHVLTGSLLPFFYRKMNVRSKSVFFMTNLIVTSMLYFSITLLLISMV